MNKSVFEWILHDLQQGRRAALRVNAQGKEYVRAFVPKDRLIILGCGHVAQALCETAAALDYEIIAVDDRPDFANTQRFPKADRVICGGFVDTVHSLVVRDTDYICVITRGHKWDRECITAILNGAVMPYYLGMISSRRRADGLRELLADEGYASDRIDRIHAPIGLSIGAVTVAEIAVSICAELVQCRRQNNPDRMIGELSQTNTDLDLLRCLAQGREPRAMLLALSSDGSTPVKSGAMMAVNRLGKGFGTIGGGCGEAAAIMRARRLIGTGASEVVNLDMTNEVAAEDGMVCGGSMKILIEDITD